MQNHFGESKRNHEYHLYRVINKYGFDNILKETLDYASDYDELKNLEV